jgi:hypothetical protein
MRDFLNAFGNSFVTAMSGLFSIIFWAVAAVGEALSFPVSVRVGFIFAAAGSMYYAAFLVWKGEVEKRKVLETRIAELEDKETSHRAELHRAQTADPHLNALRHEVQRRIEQFRALQNRAATGSATPAEKLYLLEEDTYMYLRKHIPAYLRFEGEYPIPTSWGNGEMVSSDEALQRCSARIARLTEVLTMLG